VSSNLDGAITVNPSPPSAENQPVMSMIRWVVPVSLNRLIDPSADTGKIAKLGVVTPGCRFRFEVVGSGCPAG
jgi:hypothetical protein